MSLGITPSAGQCPTPPARTPSEQRRDAAGTGAKWGGVIGGTAGATTGLLVSTFKWQEGAYGLAMYGAIGAVLGAAAGYAFGPTINAADARLGQAYRDARNTAHTINEVFFKGNI